MLYEELPLAMRVDQLVPVPQLWDKLVFLLMQKRHNPAKSAKVQQTAAAEQTKDYLDKERKLHHILS